MEMTKQRKMLIGVLCLGLGGLAVDRFVIGLPETASASDEPVAPTQAEPALPPPPVDAGVPTGALPEVSASSEAAVTAEADGLPSYASLTERLEQAQAKQSTIASDTSRENPFAMPDDWAVNKAAPAIVQSQTPQSDAAQRIASVLKLDSTSRLLHEDGTEGMLAVVSGGGLDGFNVQVGWKFRLPNADGTVDRYELVEVGSRYVTWKALSSGELILMQMQED